MTTEPIPSNRVAHFRGPASVEQEALASIEAGQILGTGPREPQR